jgi:CheY-like chemotaxis protein
LSATAKAPRLARTFDAPVIDVGLPGIDVCGVARLTREWLGSCSPLLIALTGYAAPEDREAAQRADCEVHLPKAGEHVRARRCRGLEPHERPRLHRRAR